MNNETYILSNSRVKGKNYKKNLTDCVRRDRNCCFFPKDLVIKQCNAFVFALVTDSKRNWISGNERCCYNYVNLKFKWKKILHCWKSLYRMFVGLNNTNNNANVRKE